MPDDGLAAALAYWGKAKPVDIGPIVDAAASTGKTAHVRIYGPIASIGAPYAVSAQEFGAALDDLPEDIDTIEVHIHSPGGSAFDGVAIKNQLQQHPATVNVVVDGLAASAASMIAMAGDTVSVAPSAQLMVHDASALVVGQAADLKMAAEMLDKISDSYADAYATKAGGTRADWRDAMQPETWYTAEEAVKAGLADRVLPKPKKAAEPSTLFDLTIFAHAGRGDESAPEPFIPSAHKPPADLPEKHPTTEEAVTMTETELKALREQFGLGDDADEATVTAKAIEHALAAKPDDTPPEITDDAIIAHVAKLDPEQAKALTAKLGTTDEPKLPDGMVAVPQAYLDSLKDGSEAGKTALARQDQEDRDKAIAKAQAAGKVGKAKTEVDSWHKTWERLGGAEASKWLDELPVRYPVAGLTGYAGSDGTDGDGVSATEDAAAAEAEARWGIPKEALTNG